MPAFWPSTNAEGTEVFSRSVRSSLPVNRRVAFLQSRRASLFADDLPDSAELLDSRDAWLAASLYAAAAYRSHDCAHELAEWLGVRVDAWKAGSAQGFIATLPAFDVVAIAGSNDSEDWESNRQWSSVEMPTLTGWGPVRVHEGFAGQFWRVLSVLRGRLEIFHPRPVLFVGHSLGAAIAQLLLVQRSETLPPAGAILFACPRVGGAHFAAVAGRHAQRHIWSVGDCIPHLPPWLLGWRHAGGSARFLSPSGAIYRTRARITLDYLAATAWSLGILPRRGIRAALRAARNHSIDEAARRLAKGFPPPEAL